jgi:hypothetical protein
MSKADGFESLNRFGFGTDFVASSACKKTSKK